MAISGTGVKAAGAVVARSVSAAGTLQLLIKARGPKAADAEPHRHGVRQADGDLHTDRRDTEHSINEHPAQKALAPA
jgi:hypothetical protein